MFFKDNPFYLLGLHTTDSTARIGEALQEKLHMAEEEGEKRRLMDAAWILQKSVKRSGAEFFWLPGLPKEEAYGLIHRTVDGKGLRPSDFLSLPPLSRVVLALNGLFYGNGNVRLFLKEICTAYAHIRPAEVSALFNGDRRQAGLSILRNVSHVEMWKRELPFHLAKASHQAAKDMGLSAYAALLAELAGDKESFPWQMLEMDFEEMSRGEREKLERDLDYSLRLADRHFPQGLLLAEDTLRALQKLAEPLCIRNGSWPMDTPFRRVRQAVIFLWDNGRKEEGRKMADTLLPLFREWPPLLKQAEKDRTDMAGGKRPAPERMAGGPSWQNVPSTISRIPEVKREKEKKWPLFLPFFLLFLLLTLYYAVFH